VAATGTSTQVPERAFAAHGGTETTDSVRSAGLDKPALLLIATLTVPNLAAVYDRLPLGDAVESVTEAGAKAPPAPPSAAVTITGAATVEFAGHSETMNGAEVCPSGTMSGPTSRMSVAGGGGGGGGGEGGGGEGEGGGGGEGDGEGAGPPALSSRAASLLPPPQPLSKPEADATTPLMAVRRLIRCIVEDSSYDW